MGRILSFLLGFSAWFTVVYGFCSAPGRTAPSCNRYDYAFNKTSNQKDDFFYLNSGAAVDGNSATCSNTTLTDEPWWSVDLGKKMNIEGLYLLFHEQNANSLYNYTVKVQTDTGVWETCVSAENIFASPLSLSLSCRVTGQIIQFTVMQDDFQLSLCDVGVYGTCVDMSFGNYCENECGHCNESALICDKTTGRCRDGCDTGWTGQYCKQECPFGTYGLNCARPCGNCAYNQTCNRYNGECPILDGKQCDIGYKAPYCTDFCDDGFYGDGCVPCGECKNGQACQKISGECFNGCELGYTSNDQFCRTPCDDGYYGENCYYECGKCNTPENIPGPCNKATGSCPLGCFPGYYNDGICKSACPDFKWGINCVNDCAYCADEVNGTLTNVTCIASDGSCLTGCIAGWQGVKCDERCDNGFYGISCEQVCGNCKDMSPCNHLTGLCPNPGQCEPGYLGSMCNQACSPGFYGNGCVNQCPVNCGTNCSIIDGSCVCKVGWTGPNCQDACRPNHYGKNCEIPCGNCAPGTVCNQGTGYCPQGCLDEWTGLKCDAKKIIEVYRPDYGPIIGGVIGGVIGGGLVIAFAVWVVWRYRNDKSNHPKELYYSLKRMSMRRSQQIRRSFQRLSMRAKRQDRQDRQKLDKDVEGPAQHANGHKARAPQGRMYDSVQLQSNTIHFDDYIRVYVQLQENSQDGRPKLFSAFQSFLKQRPKDMSPTQNGHGQNGHGQGSYYNVAVDDIQVHTEPGKAKIPEFLPLGSNLSGFLLVNCPADSNELWNHLQQRQIETVISIGKEASFQWRPGNRLMIGQDMVDCIDVQLFGSHKETKLTVQRRGGTGRRAVRHLECFFWNQLEDFPLIDTLLMFMDRFEQLHSTQRERSILVNYKSMHDQAILFTLVASSLEILRECKRVDVLRTVATGGNPTAKSIRTYESFKYLHDVIYEYIARTGQATTI